MTKFQLNPNERFIYDEVTARLYAPNGRLIKTIHCPKAKHWNQLIVDDNDDRTRGCTDCGERVLNLDSLRVIDALDVLHLYPNTCVHASSNSEKVIFLNPNSDRISHQRDEDDSPIEIETARTLEAINRYAAMGYWPDVRLIDYKSNNRVLKDGFLKVIQEDETGQIIEVPDVDPRGLYKPKPHHRLAQEVIRTTRYYSSFQTIPFAAYLIPKDLPNGSEVIIKDPIEDIINGYERAFNIPAIVVDRKVQLQLDKLEVRQVVG